jgi:uncharacterized membrane protein YedE/YeeE
MTPRAVAVPLLGGALIGLAATLLMYFNGRIAGISGIAGGALGPDRAERSWRWSFVVGLLAGAVVLRAVDPAVFGPPSGSTPGLVAAGLFVGVGTQLAGGCTSGHGVCGLARRSRRSLVAVGTFMATAALVVFVARHAR